VCVSPVHDPDRGIRPDYAGVALGRLYHHDNLLFCPALIEAVELEKKARYPRLLCSPCLLEFLAATSFKDSVIIRDSERDWIANIACGGPDALRDLDGILKGELTTLQLTETEDVVSWSYLQEMLPRMYQAKGIGISCQGVGTP
jgi:hypothetical protein